MNQTYPHACTHLGEHARKHTNAHPHTCTLARPRTNIFKMQMHAFDIFDWLIPVWFQLINYGNHNWRFFPEPTISGLQSKICNQNLFLINHLTFCVPLAHQASLDQPAILIIKNLQPSPSPSAKNYKTTIFQNFKTSKLQNFKFLNLQIFTTSKPTARAAFKIRHP